MSDYVIEGDCPKHSHRNGPGYECAACQVERLEKKNQALRSAAKAALVYLDCVAFASIPEIVFATEKLEQALKEQGDE